MNCDRKQAEHDAARASQTRPTRSQAPGVVRLRELLLARLAEEDDAEELDHHVAGERRDQRDQRGDDRHQHVEERSSAGPA